MYKRKTIEMKQISLQDLLTVDTHSAVIRIQDANSPKPHALIPNREVFFSSNGLFAPVRKKGICGYLGEKVKKNISLENLLHILDTSRNSNVVLLEGFAGCGKSTLVQYILSKQLQTYNYDYQLYNYDLEAQNYVLTHDESGKITNRSSIIKAIKKGFVGQFVKFAKTNTKVINDFALLLSKCQKFQPFNDLYYWLFNSKSFGDVISHVNGGMKNCERTVENILITQLDRIESFTCVLALDYLFRISLYLNRIVRKLYICYDNLDAIEDAEDLSNFDKRLIEFRGTIDDFIAFIEDEGLFEGLSSPTFVIIATYRKITARMANLSANSFREAKTDEAAGNDQNKYVFLLDATRAFSYKKIVSKRKKYFINYFKTAYNIPISLREKLQEDFVSWDYLNQKMEIMDDKYACLWNMNYRTCSIIADKLYSTPEYAFSKSIQQIANPGMDDGYNGTIRSHKEDNFLGTYYGGSAIILSSVCKVFHDNHIWDDFLKLAPLNQEPPSYKHVSFSRIILTYIYNVNRAVSLNELHCRFCKCGLFPSSLLCQILSKMLARNLDGVWRRPIYYAKGYIFSEDAEEIEKILFASCNQVDNGDSVSRNFEFLLCDSGVSYVERLMQEFEFFSNRISNKNKPLYLYRTPSEIKSIIDSVCMAVKRCCENMLDFKNEYIKLNNITEQEYLNLPIHPVTNFSKTPQLHTERTIFSHIAYLNHVRSYFLDERIISDMKKRKQFNKMFVDSIAEYLKIYYDLILPLTSARQKVAESLKSIVDKIKIAIENDSEDINIIFQSISK